jgi:inner membrane protein
MFIFGHVGISLGAAVLISGALTGWRAQSKAQIQTASEKQSLTERTGFKSLSDFLDVRLLMIGSLTPDIVDKPLAFFGFGGGRSITHTLLVLLILSAIGLYIYLARRGSWLLALSIGIFSHLVLDFMWTEPQILFWPLYGWDFPRPPYSLGFSQINIWLNSLLTNPGDIITESLGLAILLAIGWMLIYQGEFKSYLFKGKSISR